MSEPRAVVPEVLGDDVCVASRRGRLQRLVLLCAAAALVSCGVIADDRSAQRREAGALLSATLQSEQRALELAANGPVTDDVGHPVLEPLMDVPVRPWHVRTRAARRSCESYVTARTANLARPRLTRMPDDERRRARTALEDALPPSSDELRARIDRVLRDS